MSFKKLVKTCYEKYNQLLSNKKSFTAQIQNDVLEYMCPEEKNVLEWPARKYTVEGTSNEVWIQCNVMKAKETNGMGKRK